MFRSLIIYAKRLLSLFPVQIFGHETVISVVKKHLLATLTFLHYHDKRILKYIYIVTFFLGTFSPISTVHLLILVTIYFLLIGKYKDILYLWCSFLLYWYLLFALIFIGYEDSFLIGGDHIKDVLRYLWGYNDSGILCKFPFLSTFTLETVILLHAIAEYYNTTIYVPSIFQGLMMLFKGLLAFLKYLFGGKGGGDGPVRCSPADKSKSSSSSDIPSPGISPTDVRGWEFFRKEVKIETSPTPAASLDLQRANCEYISGVLTQRTGFWKASPIDWERRTLPDGRIIAGVRIDSPFLKVYPSCVDYKWRK